MLAPHDMAGLPFCSIFAKDLILSLSANDVSKGMTGCFARRDRLSKLVISALQGLCKDAFMCRC